jgi:hypothetical protein
MKLGIYQDSGIEAGEMGTGRALRKFSTGSGRLLSLPFSVTTFFFS